MGRNIGIRDKIAELEEQLDLMDDEEREEYGDDIQDEIDRLKFELEEEELDIFEELMWFMI